MDREIVIASDHAGFLLKEKVKSELTKEYPVFIVLHGE
jgi:ribose 5-phosphate isomerase RpiB